VGLLEDIEKTEFLGSEFLTWLWYMSETHTGSFNVEGYQSVEIWFYDSIKLEKGELKDKESVICNGVTSDLKEARVGLNNGKKIKEVRIKMIIDDEEWFLTIDSICLDFKKLKTPKVEKDEMETDTQDEDALFYEKVFLIEKSIAVIESIFYSFMKERLSETWDTVSVPAIRNWIHAGL
jgi:hypothetical protein